MYTKFLYKNENKVVLNPRETNIEERNVGENREDENDRKENEKREDRNPREPVEAQAENKKEEKKN